MAERGDWRRKRQVDAREVEEYDYSGMDGEELQPDTEDEEEEDEIDAGKYLHIPSHVLQLYNGDINAARKALLEAAYDDKAAIQKRPKRVSQAPAGWTYDEPVVDQTKIRKRKSMSSSSSHPSPRKPAGSKKPKQSTAPSSSSSVSSISSDKSAEALQKAMEDKKRRKLLEIKKKEDKKREKERKLLIQMEAEKKQLLFARTDYVLPIQPSLAPSSSSSRNNTSIATPNCRPWSVGHFLAKNFKTSRRDADQLSDPGHDLEDVIRFQILDSPVLNLNSFVSAGFLRITSDLSSPTPSSTPESSVDAFSFDAPSASASSAPSQTRSRSSLHSSPAPLSSPSLLSHKPISQYPSLPIQICPEQSFFYRGVFAVADGHSMDGKAGAQTADFFATNLVADVRAIIEEAERKFCSLPPSSSAKASPRPSTKPLVLNMNSSEVQTFIRARILAAFAARETEFLTDLQNKFREWMRVPARRREPEDMPQDSGCAVILTIVYYDYVITCNVGDSRAVLFGVGPAVYTPTMGVPTSHHLFHHNSSIQYPHHQRHTRSSSSSSSSSSPSCSPASASSSSLASKEKEDEAFNIDEDSYKIMFSTMDHTAATFETAKRVYDRGGQFSSGFRELKWRPTEDLLHDNGSLPPMPVGSASSASASNAASLRIINTLQKAYIKPSDEFIAEYAVPLGIPSRKLMVGRVMGDLLFKLDPKGEGPLLRADPDIHFVDVSHQKYPRTTSLVIASDGLWEYCVGQKIQEQSQWVSNVMTDLLIENNNSVQETAEILAERSYRSDLTYFDDCGVIVISRS